MINLIENVRACTLCAAALPLEPRPVVQASAQAPILIAGQAPGRKVHASGIPFDDASGERLRAWLGVDRKTFYDASKFAIVPMGFCYPGTGASGDLPPRPECAATWRAPMMAALTNVQLTLAVGRFAIDWHLPDTYPTVTAATLDWNKHWPKKLALPHPSPRNNRWLRHNPWFEETVIPQLQRRVARLLTAH